MAEEPGRRLKLDEPIESKVRLAVSDAEALEAPETETEAVVVVNVHQTGSVSTGSSDDKPRETDESKCKTDPIVVETLFDPNSEKSDASRSITQLDDSALPLSFEEIEKLVASNFALVIEAGRFPLDRYRPLSVLSKDSVSSTFLAVDRLLQSVVTIKSFNPRDKGLLSESAFKSARRMHHDNVVTVTEYGTTTAGILFIVSDYRRECSLLHYIESTGPLNVLTTIDVFLQVCDALTYLSQSGVRAESLTIDHLLLSKRTVDGGIHVRVDIVGIIEQSTLNKSSLMGNLAPGDAANPDTPVRHEEILALGIAMFKTLTGKMPDVTNSYDVKGKAPRTKSLAEAVPGRAFRQETEELIADCLSDSGSRIDSIDKFRHALLALNEVLSYSGDPVFSTSCASQARALRSSSRAFRIAFVLIVLILLPTIVLLSFQAARPIQLSKMSNDSYSVAGLALMPFMLLRDKPSNEPASQSPWVGVYKGVELHVETFKFSSEDMQGIMKQATYYSEAPGSAADVVTDNSVFYSEQWSGNSLEKHAKPVRPMPAEMRAAITKVYLTDCEILTADALEPLCQFKNLSALEFCRCKGITAESLNLMLKPRGRQRCSQTLKNISFIHTPMSGSTLLALKNIRDLNLTIRNAKFTNSDTKVLKALHLNSLRLVGTAVTDDHIRNFCSLPALQRIEADGLGRGPSSIMVRATKPKEK